MAPWLGRPALGHGFTIYKGFSATTAQNFPPPPFTNVVGYTLQHHPGHEYHVVHGPVATGTPWGRFLV